MRNPPRVLGLEFLFMPLALAIIVVAWFNPVVAWFMRAAGPDRVAAVPSPIWMVGVILASTFLTRYVLTQKVRHPRLLIVCGGLAVMIVTAIVAYRGPSLVDYAQDLLVWGKTVSPEFIVLIAGAALWWRGILIGRSQSLMEENLEQTFFNGVVALALLLYFNNLTNWLSTSDLLVAVLTFFAAALAALTIVNIERARLQRSDPGFQFTRHWIGTLVGVIGAILLGAVALTGIFSPNALREFGNSLRPLFNAVGSVLMSIFMFLIELMWRLVEPLVPLFRAIGQLWLEWLRLLVQIVDRVLTWLRGLGIQSDAEGVLNSVDKFLNSQQFQFITRSTLAVIALIAFAAAVIWALHRSGLLSRRNFEETHESIASRELLIDQLKQLMNRLRRKHEPERGLYLPLSGDDPRRAVRQAYQEFLEWARVRLQPRLPAQTPTCYAERLGNLSAAHQEPASQLTALYLRARYAADDLTPDEARAAQSALVRLQETPVIQSPLTEE
jgi:hypothetical protein